MFCYSICLEVLSSEYLFIEISLILSIIETVKWRKVFTNKGERMKFIFVPRRSLLYNNNVFPVLENGNYSTLIVFSPIRQLERKWFGFKKYGFAGKKFRQQTDLKIRTFWKVHKKNYISGNNFARRVTRGGRSPLPFFEERMS